MFDDDKMFLLFVVGFSSVKMCVSSGFMFLYLNTEVGSVKLSSMSDGSGYLIFSFLVCFIYII